VADQYDVVGSSSTIRVLSTTQAIDVEAITIVTKPSGVRLVILVPLSDFTADTYSQYLVVSADLVESVLAANPAAGQNLATAAYQSQDTDASGLIAYYVSFLVTYQPEGITALPLTQWVTFPMTTFETAAAFQVEPSPYVTLTNVYARLQALASA
jgi:hypothetical protein